MFVEIQTKIYIMVGKCGEHVLQKLFTTYKFLHYLV